MSHFMTLGLTVLALAVWPASDADSTIASPAGGALQRAGGYQVEARYSSSVMIFKVGEISFRARFAPAGYSASSFVEAAGLAALFTDFDIRAEVTGRRAAGEARPNRYAHVERTGRKVRSVDVSFDTGTAQSVAEPPFGSWGVPPASAEERTGVVDPMTAFFHLSEQLRQAPEAGCRGRLPVFDGKQRYDLRLESMGHQDLRTRAWSGEALVCHAYYEPISGYDPEDRPSEAELRHPLEIWLAPLAEGRIYLPVKLHTRAGYGGVTIEAVALDVAEG
ncbi:DUF3108 domain-containing protein [Maricaulis sp. CAU 1757]